MVLTQAELLAAIVDMFAFNTTGAITDADARSVLTDMTDTMFDLASGGGGVTGLHARYVGWSDDRVIATADFAAAFSAMNNDLELPPRTTNGYIWFAVPEDVGYPTDLHIAGGMRDALGAYERLSGTVDDGNGDPHIIGITFQLQIAALAGEPFVLGY